MKGLIIVALFAVCATHLVAQSAPQAPLTFEVASVKPVTDPNARNTGGFPPGRVFMSKVTLQTLILMAYEVPDYRVVNAGPAWIGSDYFSIEAKAPEFVGGPATTPQMMPMIRALLADRFKLVIRRESRELPIFTLVFARADGRLGPQLRRSQIDCSPEGRTRAAAAGRRVCGVIMEPTPAGLRSFKADGVLFSTLVNRAADALAREIRDTTGLSGLFDWELMWADRPEVEGPTLPIAFQEQLGLKLEPGRGPVDLLIIESAERPTPN